MSELSVGMRKTIADFISFGIDLTRPRDDAQSDKFWQGLRETGTELWLDTGDIDAARAQWCAQMSALTTNNNLLNNEIQKGIYDNLIEEADGILKNLPRKERIVEIAFILNARHGLRLVQEFGGQVSVELHTDLADDLDGIVSYGERFHEINCGNGESR